MTSRVFLPVVCIVFAIAASISLGAQTPSATPGPLASPSPSIIQDLALEAQDHKVLESHEALFQRHKFLTELRYLPAIPGKDAILKEISALKPQMILERLQVMDLPASWSGRSRDSIVLGLYNLLHHMKDMEGMIYWSNTEQKEKVLISYSRTVESPEERNEKPDQNYQKAEAIHSFWAVQEDSRLGRNLYRMEVRLLDPKTLEFVTTNQEQMWLGIIPVIRPQGMQTRVFLSVEDSGLVFYALTALDIGGGFGIDDHLSDSYKRRGDALFTWVKSRLARI